MPCKAATAHVPLANMYMVAPAVTDIAATRDNSSLPPRVARYPRRPAANTSTDAIAG